MNQALKGLGIERDEIYIANVVKCRPPMNRNPEPDEVNSCLDYLRSQVMLVKPEIIVLLGNVALKAILGSEYSITRSRGMWIEKKELDICQLFIQLHYLEMSNLKLIFGMI